MNTPYQGMTAVTYSRVSTDDKDQDPLHQRDEIRQWCEKQGVTIVGEYVEERSAKDMDRPQLMAAIGQIAIASISTTDAVPKVNLLIAWHSSRISRDEQDYKNLSNMIESYGTKIRYVQNPIETESDAGKLVMDIEAWHNEKFRSDLSDHTKMGMKQRSLAGNNMGRHYSVVFQEDIEYNENGEPCLKWDRIGNTMVAGKIRLNDKVKHRTVIVSEQDFYRWIVEGYSLTKIASDKLHVSKTPLLKMITLSGRKGVVDELIGRTERGSVVKGRETPEKAVVKGIGSEQSEREPLQTEETTFETEGVTE